MAKKYFYNLSFLLFIFFCFSCQSIRSGEIGRKKHGMLAWLAGDTKKILRSDEKEVTWKNNIYCGELRKILNPLLSDMPSDLINLIIRMVGPENHYLDGYARRLIKALLPDYNLEDWNYKTITPTLLLELAKVRDIEKIADRAITELRYMNSNKKWYERLSGTKDFRKYNKAIITAKQLKNKTWLRKQLLTLIFLLDQTQFKHDYCLNKMFNDNSLNNLNWWDIMTDLPANLLQIVGRLKDNWVGEEVHLDNTIRLIPKLALFYRTARRGPVQTADDADRMEWLDIILSLTNKRKLYKLVNTATWEEKKETNWKRYNLNFSATFNHPGHPIGSPLNHKIHVNLIEALKRGGSLQDQNDEDKYIDKLLSYTLLDPEPVLPTQHSIVRGMGIDDDLLDRLEEKSQKIKKFKNNKDAFYSFLRRVMLSSFLYPIDRFIYPFPLKSIIIADTSYFGTCLLIVLYNHFSKRTSISQNDFLDIISFILVFLAAYYYF